MRAAAATCTLKHNADIAKVQEWLGHANISTTRAYDLRKIKAEKSPTSGDVLSDLDAPSRIQI